MSDQDKQTPQSASADATKTAQGQVAEVAPDEIEGVVEVVDDDEPVPLSAENSVIAEFEAKVDFYRKESQGHQERMLRVAADFENFKRRAEREKEDVRKFGVERLLVDMLPVLDNLERAMSHTNADAPSSLLDGVQMVMRQFRQALSKYGVTSFESKGQMFDPQRHEAVQQVDSPEHPNNTVIEEYQKGYYLHDRLIRPAMVVVSRRSE